MDWDKKLRIHTEGLAENSIDCHHNRYEPTPYAVLELLANSGQIGSGNTLVDYGAGKGRAGLFLHAATGCRAIGVEYDPALYRQAMDNLASFGGQAVDFVCIGAERYEVTTEDRFYFFNPFSSVLLAAVLQRIRRSLYVYPRQVKLLFYYPDDNYLQLLAAQGLRLSEELDCRQLLASGDPKERIVIYEFE